MEAWVINLFFGFVGTSLERLITWLFPKEIRIFVFVVITIIGILLTVEKVYNWKIPYLSNYAKYDEFVTSVASGFFISLALDNLQTKFKKVTPLSQYTIIYALGNLIRIPYSIIFTISIYKYYYGFSANIRPRSIFFICLIDIVARMLEFRLFVKEVTLKFILQTTLFQALVLIRYINWRIFLFQVIGAFFINSFHINYFILLLSLVMIPALRHIVHWTNEVILDEYKWENK
ncbi:hypothetical protein FEM33_01535 [Dyadobacter flavalbus]|uniref:Uncharacterized protein n=1 Tax=Dyadobacter flavalbus TaxID=2579942 RepID=A0A5M8R5L3_9BACT|nr:hypothetical protein [Dyadobacter flavalbus]KAA6441442.1 hypothetical protein FEM33_01535 [Dyadobacter flavalbus]